MADYFESIATELLQELNVIKGLVKKHNPTIGTVTEEILRRFLKKHLPGSVSIGQGFIRNDKGETSKQCDILIYHTAADEPLYRLNDLVVIPAKSVIAIIEVKTSINSAIFHEAIDYFEQVLRVCYKPSYLFIYNSADIPAIAAYFRSYKHHDGRAQFDHDTFELLPDEITGINSSYHLKQDYVIGDRDEKGYSTFVFNNEEGTEINALQHFYMSIYDRVKDSLAPPLPGGAVGGEAYERKSFKAYWS